VLARSSSIQTKVLLLGLVVVVLAGARAIVVSTIARRAFAPNCGESAVGVARQWPCGGAAAGFRKRRELTKSLEMLRANPISRLPWWQMAEEAVHRRSRRAKSLRRASRFAGDRRSRDCGSRHARGRQGETWGCLRLALSRTRLKGFTAAFCLAKERPASSRPGGSFLPRLLTRSVTSPLNRLAEAAGHIGREIGILHCRERPR